MNRVCLTKDGKLIEMQRGGDDHPDLMEMRLNTIKQNALNAGHLETNIEVKWVTDVEYEAIKAVDPNEIARIAEQTAKETAQLAKAQEIIDNLPDWQQVSNAIDSATTIAALKVITKKLARVVYIHLRE